MFRGDWLACHGGQRHKQELAMMTSWRGNAIHITGPLCRESIGGLWIYSRASSLTTGAPDMCVWKDVPPQIVLCSLKLPFRRCIRSTLQIVGCTVVVSYIDGLVQDCSNSIANALELLQSCTKPSMFGCPPHMRGAHSVCCRVRPGYQCVC